MATMWRLVEMPDQRRTLSPSDKADKRLNGRLAVVTFLLSAIKYNAALRRNRFGKDTKTGKLALESGMDNQICG